MGDSLGILGAIGFRASLVAQMVKSLPTMRETRVRSLGHDDPLETETATHSSIQPGKSHGPRSLVGYNPWGRKELDMTEQLHFNHMENGNSILFQAGVFILCPARFDYGKHATT